jgi:LacI family transcriptional regulator
MVRREWPVPGNHQEGIRKMRTEPSPRRATLQMVAEAAGVHRSTAARALNPGTIHLISAEVAERVREAARRLGFRRDALAAGLRTGRSGLIGVVLPDIANPLFSPILGGIEAALADHGYSALVANAGDNARRQLEVVQQLMARRVDGFVLATAQRHDAIVDACLCAGVPTVLVNRAEDTARLSAVVTDDIGGMRLAVEHLAGLGHRRIGHLAGPAQISTGFLRRRGFEEAMRSARLDVSAVVVASAYTKEAGQAATAELLRRSNVTGIAAANDLLALGAYNELRARKLVCPDDVSIVGHNDMLLVDMVDPPLTTVRISHLEMGEAAARILLRQLDGEKVESEVHVTKATLVVRASTAPARIMQRKIGKARRT